MSEEYRTCHIHTTRTVPKYTACPDCAEDFTLRQNASEMSGEERSAKVAALLTEPSEIEVAHIFEWVSELVGRPVYTHEVAFRYDALLEEARTWWPSTMTAIIESIPAERRIVIEEPQP